MRRKTPGQLGVFLLKVALSLAGPDFGLAAMMTNESYLFNYYVIRTPGRGYLSAGVNYSNPKWVDGTASTDKITIAGDLGLQASLGMSMMKGFIFDITFRSTGMKYKRETTDGSNTFTDFGRGQSGDLQVGFKLIF